MKKVVEILENVIVLIFLFLISLAICMRSELNPISKRVPSIDSDVYVYIGKELNNGKVIYKDIFDHKGPLYHFIEFIGIKCSFYNYIGIWIIEVIFVTIALIFLYKTSKLITKNRILSMLAIFIAAVPLSLFFINGNYADEYALTFIAISLYYMVKSLENKAKMTKKEAFTIGFCLACVILIKINLISVWIVYILTILFKTLKNKDWKQLKDCTIYFSLGLIIPILITIIILVIQGNLIDCINEYIVFNFKYGTDKVGSLKDTLNMFVNTTYIISIIGCVTDIIYKKIVKDKNIIQPISALLYLTLCMAIIVMPKNEYKHYGIILISTYVVPLSLILKDLTLILKPRKNIFMLFITIVILFYSTLNITRRDIVNYKKDLIMVNAERFEMKDTELTKYIKEITEEDDHILVLGNECNIYLMSERTCNCKYIYQIPIVEIDNNIMDETINEIKEKKPKLIVLKLTNYTIVQEKFYEYLDESNQYEKINEFGIYQVYFETPQL